MEKGALMALGNEFSLSTGHGEREGALRGALKGLGAGGGRSSKEDDGY
jgi:hypothetical protein